jgi:hypothetical protein
MEQFYTHGILPSVTAWTASHDFQIGFIIVISPSLQQIEYSWRHNLFQLTKNSIEHWKHHLCRQNYALILMHKIILIKRIKAKHC